MELKWIKALPFWESLSNDCRKLILNNVIYQKFDKGTFLYYGEGECAGLEIVVAGQVRVFINSPSGGEITLYRLIEDDICILSAACVIKSLNFDIHMEMEQDCEIYIIPNSVYKQLSEKSLALKDFSLELVSSRFSDVMWLVNQLVFSNMGQRLAELLLERSQLADSELIIITHDTIARDLGTAREVVTRLLKQFKLEGMVELTRGSIRILDAQRLRKM